MNQTRERSPPATPSPPSGWLARLGRYTRCLLCASDSEQAWCAACHRDMLARGWRCPHCARPVQVAGPCGRCLIAPPAFDHCRALYSYQGHAATLIHRYKYQAQDWLVFSFAEYLAQHCRDSPPQCLVPIPLHWRRQFSRGFNQSQWLARQLARQLGCPSHDRLLYRQRNTPSQVTARRRRDNVLGAFALRVGQRVPARVTLVDDVLTSGATASEAARLLKANGCRTVHVWVLARATHPDSSPQPHDGHSPPGVLSHTTHRDSSPSGHGRL